MSARQRSHRTFRERMANVLTRPCVECLAGWGLACRDFNGAITSTHLGRLTGASAPVSLSAISPTEWKKRIETLRVEAGQ